MTAPNVPAPLDYRLHPERYPLDLDDEAVIHVQPYAGEMLPFLRYDTLEDAAESAASLYEFYVRAKEAGDFVGMDVACKLIHLGLRRARPLIEPFAAPTDSLLKPSPAAVFSKTYRMVRNDPDYDLMRDQHAAKHQP